MRFDLTSKKNPLTAPQNVIAKLFGQQPVKVLRWAKLVANLAICQRLGRTRMTQSNLFRHQVSMRGSLKMCFS